MSTDSSYIAEDGSYIEDITQMFLADAAKARDKVINEFIAEMEEKIKSLTEQVEGSAKPELTKDMFDDLKKKLDEQKKEDPLLDEIQDRIDDVEEKLKKVDT